MDNKEKAPGSDNDAFTFDPFKGLGFNDIDWEKEAKYVGALAGSVTGSFISTQLSWSLGLRIATVVGLSYSGAIAATVGYQVYRYLAEEES